MLKVLLKIRLQAILSHFSGMDASRTKKALTAGTALLLYLVVLGVTVGLMLLLGSLLMPFLEVFRSEGLEWLFYGMGALFTLTVSFIFTMFYAQGAIFEARDNEMLLSMPLSPAAILASRMISLFLLNLSLIIPLMGGLGVARLNAGPVTAGGTVIFILAVLLLPFISSALSCLVGWAVSMLTRRMRQKSLFQLFFSLVFLVLIYIVSKNINSYMQAVMESGRDIAVTVRRVLPPFYYMGKAVTDRDLTALLIYAAVCIVPFGILYLILSKTFIRIVTSRSGTRSAVYTRKALHTSSVTAALAKKDLIRLAGSTSYMLNAGLGIPIALAVGAVSLIGGINTIMGLIGATISPEAETAGASLSLIGVFIFGIAASMSYLSAPSISVENKSLWIMRSMPITAKQALRSKLLFHLIPTLPAFLIGAVLFCIASRPGDPILGACLVIIPLLLTVLCGELGLIANLYFHRFNYQSESAAVKSGISSVITLISVMVISLLPVLFLLIPDLDISLNTVLLIHTGILAVLDCGMWFFLNGRTAERKWNSL